MQQYLIKNLLQQFPAVAILGPRQIGKTTLAYEIAEESGASIYLDLETPSDLAKLQEPEMYFETHPGKLIILDEIQRVPEIFQVLRGVIDRRRRAGEKTGQFLILGSASLDLLQQSSESLAGRIAYVNLSGLTVAEINQTPWENQNRLWLRGGFPDSFLTDSDEASLTWRLAFIQTYLERDVPQFGYRVPANLLRHFWTMLAHHQGSMLNASNIATAMGISSPSVSRYLNLLVDLLLVRKLQPWSVNIGKRLVKAPKIYIRDSGLLHALLKIQHLDDLLGHPVVGNSWEGFVIENILAELPDIYSAWFYRTSAGAELDLLLEVNNQKRIAIEIKRSLTPTVSKGFHIACDDVEATHRYIIYPGKERFLLSHQTEVIPLLDLMMELKQ